jgi:hypothetical protein
MRWPLRVGVAVLGYIAVALGTQGCTARVAVNATGAAPPQATSLAVTVLEIWFSTSSSAAPDDASAWVRKVLPQPVTLDVATVSAGTLLTLATQLSVPPGVYRQVYLRTADSADALTTSASSAGLAFNTQISVQGSDGVVAIAPLEWLVPGVGLTIDATLDIKGSLAAASPGVPASGSTSSGGISAATGTGAITSTLVMDIDASRSVLKYRHGASTAYISNARPRLLDASLVGGISGTVDTSALVAGHAPVIVSAQALDSSGTHHVVVTQRVVDGVGNFFLYPLPAATQGVANYDVVISCADADTVIIRGVPVNAGVISRSTVVQSGAIALTSTKAVYADVADQLPQLPGGAEVTFFQAIAAGGEVPYAIAGSAVDPLVRRLPGDAFALSDGPLMVGPYAGGAAATLIRSTPVGGDGAYLPGSRGLYRVDTLAATPAVITGSATTPTQVLVPVPLLVAGGVAGTLTVRLSAPVGTYDAGFIAVSAGNRLVDTADISNLLPGGGGSIALGGIPAGRALMPQTRATAAGTNALPTVEGVTYQVVVRAWRSADTTGAVARTAAVLNPVLGDAATAIVDVALR